jgi:hypothetical protein
MSDDTPDLQYQSLLLTGDAGDAFVALAGRLQAALSMEEPGTEHEDAAFALASRLVARARGAEGAPGDAELRMAAVEHTEALAAEAEENGFDLPASVDDVDEGLMQFVEELIREAALEEHTHDAYLALHGDTDDLLLVVHPVTVAQAHVFLLGDLYARVENGILDEPLDALERGASAWYFERWRPAKPAFDDEFSAGVREQEFSLVDRPTLLDEVPFLERLLDDEELAEVLPPRQRHMARQLLGSVVGVWEVAARDGDELTLRPLAGGEDAVVLDHGGIEVRIGPGAVVLGRLIPFRDGTWLRSPGSIVAPEMDPEKLRDLAAVLQAGDAELAPAILLEGALTRLATGETPPRNVPPARSAGEAREVLAGIMPVFLEAGIAREIDRDTLPEEVRAKAPPGPLYDYEVDAAVGEWITALGAMSRRGTGGGKSKAKRKRR